MATPPGVGHACSIVAVKVGKNFVAALKTPRQFRSDDANAGLVRDAGQSVLHRHAVWADLGEARGEDHHGLGVFRRSLADDLGDARRGDCDQDKVHICFDIGDGGIGAEPLNGLAFWIHWINSALEAERSHVMDRPPADALWIIGRADDRDGTRRQEVVESGGRSRHGCARFEDGVILDDRR